MNAISLSKLENTYGRLISLAIGQNKQTRNGVAADKLYWTATIPFDAEQILNVRHVKIPMFSRDNQMYYYGIFINDIDLWRKGEIKKIKWQTLECADMHNMDSYTIFQVGTFHGTFDLMENIKFHRTFIINTKEYKQECEDRIYQHITNFIQKRIDNISKNTVMFAEHQNDIMRLTRCIDIINNAYVLSSKIRRI